MFEFHGWIKLAFTDGDSPNQINQKVIKVNNLIDKHKDCSTKFEIFYQQGKPFVRYDGYLPHYYDWVLKLFFSIGDVADDSDGVMFMKDMDNPLFESQFRVWQMSGGEVLSGEISFFPDVFNDIHQESDQFSSHRT